MIIDASWFVRPRAMTRERVSSGGVVVRVAPGGVEVALVREIDSYGHVFEGYVLPKGGLEPGEGVEAGARREIAEEIGVTALTWLADLAVLERQDANKEWWSINHYGLFLTTQPHFAITDVAHHFDPGWFPLDAIPPMFWPDERTLLEASASRIRALALAAAG